MNFVLFIIFSLTVFLISLVGYKNFRSTTLYALAIGGVVNANFFHSVNYPINCFGLPFGIDSVIYTLFIFCVVVMYIKEGKKEAYTLAISSIIAIMFSALMQLIAQLLSKGSTLIVWKSFLTFFASCLASVVAIIVMLEIFSRLLTKNSYLFLCFGVFVANVINSLIYYPFNLIINDVPANLGKIVLASIIGKVIALVCAILTLWIFNKIDNKKTSK